MRASIAEPDEHAEDSFEFPAVLPLGDGTLLALLTGRQLQARPHLPLDVPQALVRSSSADGGRTWSAPEHLAVGSWPSLMRVDPHTVACCFATWAGWGAMELMFSQDGFRSISQRLPGLGFVNHGWLPGYGPTQGWGTGWARDPAATITAAPGTMPCRPPMPRPARGCWTKRPSGSTTSTAPLFRSTGGIEDKED